MKIGYILPSFTIISGSSGGIKMQAMQWRDSMRAHGHEIVEISEWGDYDWNSIDIVHFFYFGFSYVTIYQNLKKRFPHLKFVCSPIIDSYMPIWQYKLLSYLMVPKLKIWCEIATLRKYKDLFDCFLVRSDYEQKYLEKGLSINVSKIQKVPLAGRLFPEQNVIKKENYCLHVSRNDDSGKNVLRLVEAALKYDFPLVLAGKCSDSFKQLLLAKIGTSKNIQILGRVSDEKLIDLYKRARVFALPSIREGVGLVALEAASYGCDIVITNIGGPKEYFLPNAIAVNPYSVDDIGKAVKKFIDGETYQPALRECIAEKFSEEVVKSQLLEVYKKVGDIS